MKHLHVNTKLLTCLLFFLLLLPSCNNEEIFVIEESAIIEEETDPTEEEIPNTEDEVIPIDAVDDTVNTMENTPVDIEVYLNDENLPTAITLSNTNPTNGVLTINNNDTPDNLIDDIVVYTPNAGFSGMDSFEYTLCDATNADNCDTATVIITIEPIEEDIATELKAFPTAEGAGANATGGRGGTVCHVNTLEWNRVGSYDASTDTYSGSLLYMLELSIPRMIVFDVSGTIVTNNTHPTSGNKSNMTIAGQTAPQGGITIQGAAFRLYDSNNVIIRHIRFVNTSIFDVGFSEPVFVGNGSTNVILDHCSFRYSVASPAITFQDNNNPNGNGEITVQRSLIGDCLTGGIYGAIVSEPRQGYAGTNSIHHNLFAHIDHRFPNSAGSGQFEVIENVAYNQGNKMSQFFNNSETNFINNTFKAGYCSIFGAGRLNNIALYGSLSAYTPRVYISGNRIDSAGDGYDYSPTDTDMEGIVKMWVEVNAFRDPTPEEETKHRATTPFADLGVPITKLGTDASYTNVLSDVGANRYLNADGTVGSYIDTMDQNYIDDTTNDTQWWGIIANNPQTTIYVNKTDSNVLIYPTLPTNTRPAGYDTDGDGMPNAWETANGFDPDVIDGMEDRDGDGYTNLEEFLNVVDK